MGEELRINDLQNQIQQLRHDINQLNSQLYRQSDQIMDLREVLADDKYMQSKILSTLDSLAKLVENLQQSIQIDKEEEKEVGAVEIVKEGESIKSKTALNYVTLAYNISLILLTIYQLYSNVLKNAVSGGTAP
jgi:hypothetical protein